MTCYRKKKKKFYMRFEDQLHRITARSQIRVHTFDFPATDHESVLGLAGCILCMECSLMARSAVLYFLERGNKTHHELFLLRIDLIRHLHAWPI